MLRILVIDDSPIFLETITDALRQFPAVAVVGACRNAAAGVFTARETRPDLVLVDLNMPTTNGLEAAATLRSNQPGLLIVIVSMQSARPDAARLQAAGADAYVYKPELFGLLPDLIARGRRIARLQS